MSSLQSLDLKQRSATTTPPPSVRADDGGREADRRLASASAARPARSRAANGTTCATRSATTSASTTTRRPDAPRSWTVMRFSEYEEQDGRLEWLIRKDGCMHCADPGLPQGLPVAGRDRAVLQRHRRFRPGALHRLRLLRHRLPVQHSAHLEEGQQGLQVHAVLRPRVGGPRAGVREDLSDRRDHLRQQGGHEGARRGAHRRPEEPRLPERGPLRSAGRGRHARDVRAEARRQARDLSRAAGRPAYQPAGEPVEGSDEAARRSRRWASPRWRRCSTTCGSAPRSRRTTTTRTDDPAPPRPEKERLCTLPPTPSSATTTWIAPRTGSWRSSSFSPALSGLAFFHPSLFWLTDLFGGGPWTPHPSSVSRGRHDGLLRPAGAAGLAPQPDRPPTTVQWLAKAHDVMAGHEERAPPAGRYNAGQKVLFWLLTLCMLGLLVTGFCFWRPYRGCAAHHPDSPGDAAARGRRVGLILLVMGHIYMSFWTKESIRAMTQGWVTRRWARSNHPAWHDEVVRKALTQRVHDARRSC